MGREIKQKCQKKEGREKIEWAGLRIIEIRVEVVEIDGYEYIAGGVITLEQITVVAQSKRRGEDVCEDVPPLVEGYSGNPSPSSPAPQSEGSEAV